MRSGASAGVSSGYVIVESGASSLTTGSGGDIGLLGGLGSIGGDVVIRSGASRSSRYGGSVHILGGKSDDNTVMGGSIILQSGRGSDISVFGGTDGGLSSISGGNTVSMDNSGGMIDISSGSSAMGASGSIALASADAIGVSGDIMVPTGSGNLGGSGSILISSGHSYLGRAGDIEVKVGASSGISEEVSPSSLNLKGGDGELSTGSVTLVTGLGSTGSLGGEISMTSDSSISMSTVSKSIGNTGSLNFESSVRNVDIG